MGVLVDRCFGVQTCLGEVDFSIDCPAVNGTLWGAHELNVVCYLQIFLIEDDIVTRIICSAATLILRWIRYASIAK